MSEATAEIESAWRLIESEFEIEPRSQIEAEAKVNGFKYGLAQAIHTIWKRDPKVSELLAELAFQRQKAYMRNDIASADRISKLIGAKLPSVHEGEGK